MLANVAIMNNTPAIVAVFLWVSSVVISISMVMCLSIAVKSAAPVSTGMISGLLR